MKSNIFLRTVLILLVLVLNIGCDQVSKTMVRNHIQYFDRIDFFSHHFTLSRVENSGAFLSMGDSLSGPVKTVLLNILPLIAVLYGLYFLFTKTSLNTVTLIAVIMIVGGGIGNLYDRMVHGSVTDFMHINFGMFQTGIFNVADMSITAGTIMILIYAWVTRKHEVEASDIPEESQI